MVMRIVIYFGDSVRRGRMIDFEQWTFLWTLPFRLFLLFTFLLVKSRFNETHKKISVKAPANRTGGTKQDLNGELALFIIGSDDMWRVIAEFL